MGYCKAPCVFLLCLFISFCLPRQLLADEVDKNLTAQLFIDASEQSSRPIPQTLFGIFFEEINHAGAGGLWAELVSNRGSKCVPFGRGLDIGGCVGDGFEAGGANIPSNIDPWSIIGDESSIIVSTDRSSCFERNKVALKMEVLCNSEGTHICPSGGVGIYNPGFWGMNIEQGKSYKIVIYVRSTGEIDISVSFTSSDGLQTLSSTNIKASASDVSNWTKMEVLLEAKETNHNSRLQLTTSKNGVVWFDQVSAMPLDTYKGHGFRNELAEMLADIKPRFIRFPGGCFVEGEWLRNAFRWKASVGPWEERPGHFGDVWMYWTDDGLGYFEFLQVLAEDLGALPIWVFNNGISHNDQVDTSSVLPFVQEALDGIEFARGDASSTWGAVRAAMGHPEPFDLKYVAIGNEDCGKKNYRESSSFLVAKFWKKSFSGRHGKVLSFAQVYTSANNLFSMSHKFDRTTRQGPKAFVSEYAVTGKDAGTGSLLAALAEAAFLIGGTQMQSSSTPFRLYGTPSYWVQRFFTESSGATLLNATLQKDSSNSLVASAITWKNSEDGQTYVRIKVVNFGSNSVNLQISVDGLDPNSVKLSGSTKTTLTSANLMDENSFKEPKKVAPNQTLLEDAQEMSALLRPHSFTSFDLLKESVNLRITEDDSSLVSSI
ncbi:hypothetical protein GOBAR_DD14470 [Gossypium barbadense]|nr:hypothetical protein GOBAR_DD14470 [Gossypium barbadense]